MVDPQFVNLGLLKTFRLGSAILEPDLHLDLRQAETRGEFRSFWDKVIRLSKRKREREKIEKEPRWIFGESRDSRLMVITCLCAGRSFVRRSASVTRHAKRLLLLLPLP